MNGPTRILFSSIIRMADISESACYVLAGSWSPNCRKNQLDLLRLIPQAIDPMKCWASCLGGCSNKISREHTVTQAMFLDKEIEVSGMPWCVEPKKVGLANLTAKVLCAVHNSALSPVDQEAVKFAEALRESFRLLQVRHSLKPRRWTVEKFHIDGPRTERWLLKT